MNDKPFDLAKGVRKLLHQNKPTSAMILYQSHTGCGLEEAQRYIDSL